MKTVAAAVLLFSSLGVWAQVNPTHPTLVCSGKIGSEVSVIFKGPAWGSDESFGFNDYSLKILKKTVTPKQLIFAVEDLEKEKTTLTIDLQSGKATLPYFFSEVKNYQCKSSTSVREDLELEDFLIENNLPR